MSQEQVILPKKPEVIIHKKVEESFQIPSVDVKIPDQIHFKNSNDNVEEKIGSAALSKIDMIQKKLDYLTSNKEKTVKFEQ